MHHPTILMCPPDHYDIEYEINPWMSRARGAVKETAQQQWRNLYETLVSLGVRVELLEAKKGLPDLVFTANAGLMFNRRFISARFRHEERASETPVFDAWFAEYGYEVEHLPEGMFFEGAGDALFCGPILFAGYRIRSDAAAHQEVGRMLGKQVLPLELVHEHFYHLDTCFCPLAPGQALWFPDAFDSYAQKVIRSNIPQLIEVQDADAKRFGCNAVVVGRNVVINAGCEQLARDLQDAGYGVLPVALDEFLKAGGSAKCLTLRLDGEEAAEW